MTKSISFAEYSYRFHYRLWRNCTDLPSCNHCCSRCYSGNCCWTSWGCRTNKAIQQSTTATLLPQKKVENAFYSNSVPRKKHSQHSSLTASSVLRLFWWCDGFLKIDCVQTTEHTKWRVFTELTSWDELKLFSRGIDKKLFNRWFFVCLGIPHWYVVICNLCNELVQLCFGGEFTFCLPLFGGFRLYFLRLCLLMGLIHVDKVAINGGIFSWKIRCCYSQSWWDEGWKNHTNHPL